MNWRKIWVIARHEYLINVKRAGFIIMTAIVPALGAVTLLAATLLSGQAQQVGDFLERQFEVGNKPIGVVDRSGHFASIKPAYEEDFISYESEGAAEAAVEAEEISKALVIGEDYLENGKVVVVTAGSGFDAASVSDSSRVRAFFVDHLLSEQVDPALQERVIDPLNVESRVLSDGGRAQDRGPWGIVFTFAVPYVLAFFLIMSIFVSSGYLLRSVAEEKESRVVEIVVSSVRPMELMAGKVLGLGALGLTQVLTWLLSSLAFSGGVVALLAAAGAVTIPMRVLILGVLYYVLGYVLYAILMAGVGALGTTMRESQQLAGIFSFLAAAPLWLSSFLFAAPNALLARVLSFFPLTAPTIMMMRVPLGGVPNVDIIGSIVTLLIAIPAALWVGAKLFRVGLLIYGKRPTLREIWGILRT